MARTQDRPSLPAHGQSAVSAVRPRARRLPSNSAQPAHRQLSPRELHVFLDLARGVTVGDIAAALLLSPKTVTTYRMRLMAKLQVTSNWELTQYAHRNGLIE